MSAVMILLALLGPPQDPKPPDAATETEKAEKAKRAAIVDRIIADPKVIRVQPVPAPAPAFIQVRPVIATFEQQNAKRITLELREVEEPADGDERPEPLAFARPININDYALSKDNFDRWVFDDSRTDEGRRNHLGHLLTEKIHAIERDGALEPEQVQKLRLAGSGDVKRFFDRVDAARADFEVIRQDYKAGRNALALFDPLSTDYQGGPFGPDSVFEKTLRKIRAGQKSAQEAKK